MSIDSKRDLDGPPRSRAIVHAIRVLAASLLLVAGPAESLDEYLVIVNHGTGDAVVSYRPGVFRGPDLEAVAMLQKPMQSAAKNHTNIRKYWVLPDERIVLSSGVVTFTLPSGFAAMIGGIWPPTDDPPPSDGNVAFLEIESRSGQSAYDGDGVLSAFSERSRNLRVLEVR